MTQIDAIGLNSSNRGIKVANMRGATKFFGGLLALVAILCLMTLGFWDRLVADADAPALRVAVDTPQPKSDDSLLSPNVSRGSNPERVGALAESPERFANSPANPFACPPAEEGVLPCDWERDPTVARSIAEAEWMALQGYPTLEQRAWAKSQTTEAVLLEARRTGSAALWSLGLERAAVEATSIESAAEATLELGRLATSRKSLYALEQQGVLQAHLIEMAVMKGGWAPADRELQRAIDEALGDARRAALQAALLGDGLAMQRIENALHRIPGIIESPLGARVERGQTRWLGGDIRLIHQEMQWNAAALRAGRPLPYGGFTLADVRPRPVQSNVIGDGRPGGQWLEY
ncbi:MAG: hypothetical protein ACK52I_19755 [Pseudomonadota bacterium]|jgi:hypothetical protein|uniref:hypothetical protein n=1 Tax=Silanimonas sp. TaxID=1929290 RepID=UPI0022C0984C|nr:hypothetical protein [Silanimonas sp.]MCZ8114166.1 hypothetical protein [Silanimonas sp.]